MSLLPCPTLPRPADAWKAPECVGLKRVGSGQGQTSARADPALRPPVTQSRCVSQWGTHACSRNPRELAETTARPERRAEPLAGVLSGAWRVPGAGTPRPQTRGCPSSGADRGTAGPQTAFVGFCNQLDSAALFIENSDSVP